MALARQRYGEDNSEFATALNWLSLVYHDQGRYAEAEPLYRRSLVIREKVLGPEHPDVAQSLNNLAQLYWAQSRFTDAEPLYQRSLSIYVKAPGPRNTAVLQLQNNLAGLFADEGRCAEAEPLYRRNLSIYETVLDPDHPNIGELLPALWQVVRRPGPLCRGGAALAAEPRDRRESARPQ